MTSVEGLPGFVVVVAAVVVAGSAAAQTQIEIEGPLTAVSPTAVELFDGRLRVDVTSASFDSDVDDVSSLAELATGNIVEIEAEVAADGSIRAIEVELSDENQTAGEIEGRVESVDRGARTFTIGPLRILWTDDTVFADNAVLEPGRAVELVVELVDGELTARRVAPD